MKNDSPAFPLTQGDARGSLTERELAKYVAMLKALAHPVLLRMVDLIHEGGELCVCEFEHHFELTQPTISHHLKILREAGVIRSRQDGSWVRHSIEPGTFARMQQLMDVFSGAADMV